MNLPNFFTHYFESDKGPFRNICDLSDAEIASIIASERHAKTAFNRFALGIDFFKIRRAADDLLIEKYSEKFGICTQAHALHPQLQQDRDTHPLDLQECRT
jgi:hypothetical protein